MASTETKPVGPDRPYFRFLQPQDQKRGYITLLSQLTSVGNANTVSSTEFSNRVKTMRNAGSLPYVLVDPAQGMLDILTQLQHKLVGCGTLFLERKPGSDALHGHIEDIVVDGSMRGRGMGIAVIRHLLQVGFNECHCSAIMLDCSEKNVDFYEKCGLHRDGIQLRFDVNEKNVKFFEEFVFEKIPRDSPMLMHSCHVATPEQKANFDSFWKRYSETKDSPSLSSSYSPSLFSAQNQEAYRADFYLSSSWFLGGKSTSETQQPAFEGVATVVFEPKFLHSLGMVAHLTDLVIVQTTDSAATASIGKNSQATLPTIPPATSNAPGAGVPITQSPNITDMMRRWLVLEAIQASKAMGCYKLIMGLGLEVPDRASVEKTLKAGGWFCKEVQMRILAPKKRLSSAL